jgi:hypothetical protein
VQIREGLEAVTDDDGDEIEAELVDDDGDGEDCYALPFVVTQPDGPYDPDSYEAGWEAGILSARLGAAQFHGLGLPAVMVHRANLPQVSLLAMAVGATDQVVPWDPATDPEIQAEWAYVTFAWGTALPDGVPD